jgi:hypothetical protein
MIKWALGTLNAYAHRENLFIELKKKKIFISGYI